MVLKPGIYRTIITAPILFVSMVCLAGPPFDTDDPEPVDFKHWEYYLSSQNVFLPGNAMGTLPHFELNYGLIKNCQIHFELPMNYSYTPERKIKYGYGNTEIGFKYRFYTSSNGTFQIGTFPIAEVPTINNPEFTNNRMQLYLPVWLQKTWNRLTTYGGAGYWFNPGDNNKNWLYSGWEVQYDVSRYFTFGGELFYRTSPTKDGQSMTGFNLGGFVNFSEKIHFIYSAGHSITGENTTMAYAGLLITL